MPERLSEACELMFSSMEGVLGMNICSALSRDGIQIEKTISFNQQVLEKRFVFRFTCLNTKPFVVYVSGSTELFCGNKLHLRISEGEYFPENMPSESGGIR